MAKDIDDNKGVVTERRPTPGKATLLIDVDYYQRIIDDPEVSEDRKRELIEIIGAIVLNFIDIGFGVHPVQRAVQGRENRHQTIENPKEEESSPERSGA